jgi:hypothetical protein
VHTLPSYLTIQDSQHKIINTYTGKSGGGNSWPIPCVVQGFSSRREAKEMKEAIGFKSGDYRVQGMFHSRAKCGKIIPQLNI